MRLTPKNMSPNEIRSLLARKGVRQASIARALGVSHTTVNRVINSLVVSDRVRRAIAAAIGIEVERIWPETYLNGGPRKPGRPECKPLTRTVNL